MKKETLKKYMDDNDLTQKDIAKSLKMTQGAVSQWFTNEKRKLIPKDCAEALADIYVGLTYNSKLYPSRFK